MSAGGGYSGWRAVEQAIKQAAVRVHAEDPGREIEDVIRQVHYDRFLCRVFGGDTHGVWVLKGGTGMLARVANARRTQDIDLYLEGHDKDTALSDLRELAVRDLGDFFSFTYRSHAVIAAGDNQPQVDGYHVVFDATLGLKPLQPIHVDLVASVFATVGMVQAEPANRVALPRLAVFPYRLYPVANQIADKVTATIAEYRGKPSSRERDLADLVVLALTQTVQAAEAHDAIVTECHLRRLPVPEAFSVPSTWGRGYARIAAQTAPAVGYESVEMAMDLMRRFLDPVLAGTARGTWDPATLEWTE